jgi:hypothetical protein
MGRAADEEDGRVVVAAAAAAAACAAAWVALTEPWATAQSRDVSPGAALQDANNVWRSRR